jgi:hypothetical protein
LVECTTNRSILQDSLRTTWAFASIDTFDASNTLPQLGLLQQYDAALVWSSGGAANPLVAGLGNVLAQYWDGGGAVVLAADATSGGKLSGRFADPTAGYILIDGSAAATTSKTGADNLFRFRASSPLLAGVSRLGAQQNRHRQEDLINGAVEVASTASGDWGSGWPLVLLGAKAGRPLVALNMYPVSAAVSTSYGWTGDGAALLRNAILFSVCSACGAKYRDGGVGEMRARRTEEKERERERQRERQRQRDRDRETETERQRQRESALKRDLS